MPKLAVAVLLRTAGAGGRTARHRMVSPQMGMELDHTNVTSADVWPGLALVEKKGRKCHGS